MMAGIRGKDTKPELLIRKGLHALGLRFRLGDRYRIGGRTLPGRPDLVFPGRRAVILVHGCFWHGHDCHLFKWPKTRPEFWRAKIARNREVDRLAEERLLADGWRVATVWECAIKGRTRLPTLDALISPLEQWIVSGGRTIELSGRG